MFLVFTNEYSVTRQRSYNGSFSIWKRGCLLLKMPRPSVSMHRQKRDAVFCLQCFRGLSPHKILISTIFLHQFCQVTFNCLLRTFLSLSVAWVLFSTGSSYTGSGGYVTDGSGPLNKISNWIPFFAKIADFPCCNDLSHESGDVIVGFS